MTARPQTPEAVSGDLTASGQPNPIAARMSERELEQGVRRILKDLPGILAYHTHDSRRSPEGFPDWVFASVHGVMYRELKKQRGVVTAAQTRWLDTLSESDQDAGIWRPADLLSGRIACELAALAGLGRVP